MARRLVVPVLDCCLLICPLPLEADAQKVPKMSVSPMNSIQRAEKVMHLLAETHGVDIHTVRRWASAGKIPGIYRLGDGRYRFRRLPKEKVDAVIKESIDRNLRHIKAEFFPHLDDVIEMWLVRAGITNDDIAAITHPNPDVRAINIEWLKARYPLKWQLLFCGTPFFSFNAYADGLRKPHAQLQLKAEILRLHGYPVTRENLAAILGISVNTLRGRYKAKDLCAVCQPVPVRDEEPEETRNRYRAI